MLTFTKKATLKDIQRLALTLCENDKIELMESGLGDTLIHSLLDSYLLSYPNVWVAYNKNTPVGIGGYIAYKGRIIPFILSVGFKKYPISFYREAKKQLNHILQYGGEIFNFTLAAHTDSHKFLKSLGFTIDKKIYKSRGGKDYYYFYYPMKGGK